MSRFLSPLDATFLYLERGSMLAHVAGLQIFSLPKDAPQDFLHDLIADLRRPLELAYPWNQKLKASPIQAVLPSWETTHDIDMEYHVRHLALPGPGGERELGVMISRLHSQLLDRRRPLWECHVIEGLENNRFAIYIKIHHALVDGVTALRLMTQSLSETAKGQAAPPWAYARKTSKPRLNPPAPGALEGLRNQLRSVSEAGQAAGRIVRSAMQGGEDLAVPLAAPASPLNVKITSQRRFATQQFDLARLKAVGAAVDATVNDVVLALSSAALRRFLQEGCALPKRPLVAAIPVSLRPPGDQSAGNNVCIMLGSMATDVADPKVRLETIRDNTARVKAHLSQMTGSAINLYTAGFIGPFMVQQLSGLSGRTRPYFNLAISNVPGPQKKLYLSGAELQAVYPVSNMFDGQALNITCTSYAGTLNFGFMGCRDALPSMQRLAVYAGEALEELEVAVGLNGKPGRTSRKAA